MDFTERLKKIRSDFESGETPQDIVETLSQNIDRLIANGAIQNALTVDDSAPLDLPAVSESGEIQLREFIKDKYLVMTWFRGNW